MQARSWGIISSSIHVPLTPLGEAFWQTGMYFDARDYPLSANSEISTALRPRVGASNCTPQTSGANFPVYKQNSIGGRGSILFTAAQNQGFNCHFLASIMSGDDKPGSVMMRIMRADAASQTFCGWGSSASATQNFCEVFATAAGFLGGRKNQGGTLVTQNGTTNLQFTTRIVTFTTPGTTVNLYIDGVLEASFPKALDVNSVTLNQFRFGSTGRSSAGAGFGGYIQCVAVTPNVLSLGQISTIKSTWEFQDAQPNTGAPIYWIGDSITKRAGMREVLYNYIVANSLHIDAQGSFHDGAFPDNEHSAVNGVEINSVNGRAVSELGTGNAFPGILLILVMAGTNNVNNVPYNNTTTLTQYADMLEDMHTAVTSSNASAKICVTTILPIEPGVVGDTNVPLFNGGLPAIWDAFDLAHPSNILIRWDANQAMGPWSPLYFADSAHPNTAGYQRICDDPTYGLLQAVGPYLASISPP